MANSYQITLKNNSAYPWTFYIYQSLPYQAASNIFSLAWFASPFSMAPDTQITFQWSIDYGFVWGASGNVMPGVTFNAAACVPADLMERNSIRFANIANAPSFDFPGFGGPPGSLVISSDATVPYNTFSVGMSMSGAGAFVTQAGPNLNQVFTPGTKPTYYIAAGTGVRVGTVLDIEAVELSRQVVFPDDIYALTYVLGPDGTWADA